jgi:hypothetical protein
MLMEWVLVVSVFFRGFRGHNIRDHQFEKALGRQTQVRGWV